MVDQGSRGTDVNRHALRKATWCAAAWAAVYAVYRAYYAFGGQVGMIGIPLSADQFRYINAVAALMLSVAAVAPVLLLHAWWPPRWNVVVLGCCWLMSVGCIGHALIGATQRVLSLAGLLTLSYPFWLSIDSREADWQALLWNEPWFLIEGVLWSAIAWIGAVRAATWRQYWVAGLLVGIATFTLAGLLSTFGVIGRYVVG